MTSKNRPEIVIRQVTPEITTFSIPFALSGIFKFGMRSTLVKLANGSLAVFSPISLTTEIRDTIKAQGGKIRYIAAPGTEHHLYLTEWKEAYPDAQIIAPERLQEKRENSSKFKGTTFQHIFTRANKHNIKISDEFEGEFDVEYMDGHSSHELIFCHKPTRTLIEADLLFNMPALEQYSKSSISPLSGIANRFMRPFVTAQHPATWQRRFAWYVLSSADRKSFTESIARIYAWDFDRLIPCHGDVIETGAKNSFRNVFEYFLDDKRV
ncbi:beta-lactamase-like protein [Xylogone sp. PMI_703]|nr:beta-lactamase-like protein [Xylogone sp. PMI_703]